MKLEHIGIAVKNIEKGISVWQGVLGLEHLYTKEVPDQKVRVAVFDCHGIRVELLEALDDQSPISSFLRRKGEGVHHLCFEVEDIDAALEKMKHDNVRLIDEKPKVGAAGRRIAFIHPKDTGGVLIELTEP